MYRDIQGERVKGDREIRRDREIHDMYRETGQIQAEMDRTDIGRESVRHDEIQGEICRDSTATGRYYRRTESSSKHQSRNT